MPFEIRCTSGHAMQVPQSRAGTKVRCAVCGEKVLIPQKLEPSFTNSELDEIFSTKSEPEPPNTEKPTSKIPNPELTTSLSKSSKEAGEQEPKARGFVHDRSKCWAVYSLSIFLALVAVIGMVPTVLELISHLKSPNSPGIANWAICLIFLGMVQLAYAFYLAQLPDWSSTWVVTLVTLMIATMYAFFLGISFFRGDPALAQWLDLSEVMVNGQAARWCFIMLCLTSLLAYFSGRVSIRWRKSYIALSDASMRTKS